MTQSPNVVNDITGLNPVPVWAIVTPRSTDDVVDALRRSDGPVSIGGGRYSMGGQSASPMSLHLDMRQMNKVLGFSPSDKTIRVQAGTRWRDIQRFIDPHGLSVKIMQTYANFTRRRRAQRQLPWPLHGPGAGDPVGAQRSGWCWPTPPWSMPRANENRELFFAAIGGYGSVGVIVEAELDLADNHRVQRLNAKMNAGGLPAPLQGQDPQRQDRRCFTTPTSTRPSSRACAR